MLNIVNQFHLLSIIIIINNFDIVVIVLTHRIKLACHLHGIHGCRGFFFPPFHSTNNFFSWFFNSFYGILNGTTKNGHLTKKTKKKHLYIALAEGKKINTEIRLILWRIINLHKLGRFFKTSARQSVLVALESLWNQNFLYFCRNLT